MAYIGKKCFSESGITEFSAPPGLREIEDQAFSSCMSLKRVVLNEGLIRLGNKSSNVVKQNFFDTGNGVFLLSALEEVVLPATLKEIGQDTFEHCNDLKVVWAQGNCAADVR